jgi:glycosyltransferase involved in cell wall biosynthesis
VISAARWLEGGRIILRGVGPYEKTLKELVSKENVHDKVTIVKPVTINELISSASECDIGLNPFINVCKNTEYVLPNKFFEYMMAGLALASADLIEMRKLTEKLNIGILFNPNQPEEIAENLNSLIRDRERLEHYRRNAYEAARTEYHWEMEEHKLFHLYDRFL